MLHCFRPTTLALALLLARARPRLPTPRPTPRHWPTVAVPRCPSTSCVPSPRFSTG